MDIGIVEKAILDRHNCEMDGLERIYRLSFEHKELSLRHTNPIMFEVGGFKSNKAKWMDVIIDFAIFLSNNCNLLKFKPKWCLDSYLFTAVSAKNSWEVKINDRLYFNSSQAINHLYLFIKDIIAFADLSLTNIVIKYKCLPIVEPQGIRDVMSAKMKSFFRMDLEANDRSLEEINLKIIYINAVNKRIKTFINSSYDNVYLITNKERLYDVITRFISKLETNSTANEEQIKNIKEALMAYYDFFCFFLRTIKSGFGRRCFGIQGS